MSDTLSPEDAAMLKRLDWALARMPTLRREVFLFVRVERHSHAETADVFGISEAKVLKHVARAMWDLRRRTAPQDFTLWQRLWPLF